MQYRRAKTPSGTFFFTVVTHHRRKFLCVPENIILLRQVFREVMTEHPFKIDAAVILPDHLHCVCYHPDVAAPRRRFLYPLATDQEPLHPSL